MLKDFTDKLMSALITCLSSDDEKVRLAAIKSGINLLEAVIPKLTDKERVDLGTDIQERVLSAIRDCEAMTGHVEGKPGKVAEKAETQKCLSSTIIQVIREGVSGKLDVSVLGKKDWEHAYNDTLAFAFGDWRITFFIDCYELDYVYEVVSPELHVFDFHHFADNEGEPLGLMGKTETALLEKFLKEKAKQIAEGNREKKICAAFPECGDNCPDCAELNQIGD